VSNGTSFMNLCNWKRKKNSKVTGRLGTNDNHDCELKPWEVGEEAAKGNIEGGKTEFFFLENLFWEEKGFDAIECHLKDNIIDKKYSNSFPLGFALVKEVIVQIDRFKKVPPKIVYHPLLKAHVNEIKTGIIVYNKFDTKAPIFAIPKDPNRPYFILPHAPSTWEEIKDLQFLIVGG
jgi:hypothetical protein